VTEPPRTAYDCWLIARREGGSEHRQRWRYHELLVQYGFLIPKEDDGRTPRFACGWDPDASRRVIDAI
jgi:hypothetical protein